MKKAARAPDLRQGEYENEIQRHGSSAQTAVEWPLGLLQRYLRMIAVLQGAQVLQEAHSQPTPPLGLGILGQTVEQDSRIPRSGQQPQDLQFWKVLGLCEKARCPLVISWRNGSDAIIIIAAELYNAISYLWCREGHKFRIAPWCLCKFSATLVQEKGHRRDFKLASKLAGRSWWMEHLLTEA